MLLNFTLKCLRDCRFISIESTNAKYFFFCIASNWFNWWNFIEGKKIDNRVFERKVEWEDGSSKLAIFENIEKQRHNKISIQSKILIPTMVEWSLFGSNGLSLMHVNFKLIPLHCCYIIKTKQNALYCVMMMMMMILYRGNNVIKVFLRA